MAQQIVKYAMDMATETWPPESQAYEVPFPDIARFDKVTAAPKIDRLKKEIDGPQ